MIEKVQTASVDLPGHILPLLQKQPLDMKPVLVEVEKILPRLRANPDFWTAFSLGDNELSMHTICTSFLMRDHELGRLWAVHAHLHLFPASPVFIPEEKFPYHAHPWASAMHILEGHYDQWTGHATDPTSKIHPPKISRSTHRGGDMYAMNEPELWHQIILPPKDVWTLMVTHQPSDWPVPSPYLPPRLLNRRIMDYMLEKFQGFYPAEPSSPVGRPQQLPRIVRQLG